MCTLTKDRLGDLTQHLSWGLLLKLAKVLLLSSPSCLYTSSIITSLPLGPGLM